MARVAWRRLRLTGRRCVILGGVGNKMPWRDDVCGAESETERGNAEECGIFL